MARGLSVGDLHFSQGDGEITFCGAIEMAGWVHMRVSSSRAAWRSTASRTRSSSRSPITPTYNDYLIFEGISVDEAGKQYYLDVHIAYRQACLNAIEYLKKFGYSGAQAYSILGTAPVQGHIRGVVDIPNACATLWLPTEIFDFDINPARDGRRNSIKGGRQCRSPRICDGAMPTYEYVCARPAARSATSSRWRSAASRRTARAAGRRRPG